MSMIYCNIDMFSQKANLIDETGKTFATIDIDKIDTILPQYCYSKGIDNIHFIGMNEYVKGLIHGIENTEITNYGYHKLNFEIN